MSVMPTLTIIILYIGIFLVLGAIAVGGIFFGRYLRKRKNTKES